jgi:hypothetical protein
MPNRPDLLVHQEYVSPGNFPVDLVEAPGHGVFQGQEKIIQLLAVESVEGTGEGFVADLLRLRFGAGTEEMV